jgi:hypothetical protein
MTNAVTLASIANSGYLRNRIINGNMVIDQRNAGASVTPSVSSTYTLDRWIAVFSQASKFSVQRSTTAPAGFNNSSLITSTSAYTVGASEAFSFRQYIEGINVADLAWGTASAQSVTLSFWVRSSLTGTFGGSFLNSAANRSYPFSYTISSANTWEYKAVTIPGDTTGTWLTDSGIGINLIFNLGAGSTISGTANAWAGATYVAPTGAASIVGTNGATLYITGVQLEVGSIATPFERRLHPVELAMCQRYFEYASFNVYGYQSTAGEIVGGGVNFRVVKRAQPTLGSIVVDTGATPASSNVASQGVNTPGLYGCAIFCVGSASANAGVNQRGYMFSASSEL